MNAAAIQQAVILNGVSPGAQAGAKWSEGSLKVRGRRRSGSLCAPSLPPPPPAFQSAILRFVTVADSRDSAQDDGWFFGGAGAPSPRAAFTFIEILAAMAFLGILLPVLISALLVSSRAGSVAERSTVAMQLGENRLNELTLGSEWSSAESRGDFGEDWPGYRWELTQADWQTGEMTELTMRVVFTVQGHEHDVMMSTLVSDSLTEEP